MLKAHIRHFPGASLTQITDGLVCKGVQMSGGNVLLKLFVPRGGIKLGEQVAESQKLLAGKPADGRFDLVNGTHAARINQPGFQGKRRSTSCGRTHALASEGN